MKSRIILVAGLGFTLLAFTAVGDDTPKGEPELKDVKSKGSYAFGIVLGRDLKSRGIDIDEALLLKGLRDTMSGGKIALTDEQAKAALSEMLAEASQHALKKSKADGEAFLAENKKKPGVVTLPSGLQYKVITEGKGKTPKETDKVSCNYRGTLIDGTEFDSSYKRNAPSEFPVNGVIPGWVEALQLMKVGSKWQLFVPTELGYGLHPRQGGAIKPNDALIFEIELLEVK